MILAVTLDQLSVGSAMLCWFGGLALSWYLALFLRGYLVESQQFIEDLQHLNVGQLGQRMTRSSIREWQLVSERINELMRHAADIQLAHSAEQARLNQIIEALASGFIAIDQQENILIANDRAKDLLALHQDVPYGNRLWEWVRQPALNEVASSVLKHGGSQEAEIVSHRPGGDQTLQVIAAAVQDDTDDIVGATIMLIDVTPIRRLEEMRRDFIANVSQN